jgi:hypothetical protein
MQKKSRRPKQQSMVTTSRAGDYQSGGMSVLHRMTRQATMPTASNTASAISSEAAPFSIRSVS